MNCSIFRQHKKYAEDEDSRISEFSDTDNEWNTENQSTSHNTSSFKENRDFLNTTEASFYIPKVKRYKQIPLIRTQLKTRQTLARNANSRQLEESFDTTLREQHEQEREKEEEEEEERSMQIEWSSTDQSDNNATNLSRTQSTQDPAITELDLFLSLIERENTENSSNTVGRTKVNSKNQNVPNYFKRCRRGGYLHQLKKSLQNAKTEHRYFKHDKKFGIRDGTSLRVLELEVSFGVHIATVITQSTETFQTVLDTDMAKHLQTGSQLEAFFDENIEPYLIDNGDTVRTIFLQPSKVMICKE